MKQRFALGWVFALWIIGSVFTIAQEKRPHEFAWEDPNKIKTPETCRRCHVSTYEVWRKTTHATGFKTLHRTEAAEAIAKKMGFKLIKRESLCLTCHYTPIIKNDVLRGQSGISCESCHGAAADWLEVHSNHGGKGFTADNETPEHKAHRIAETRRLGMRRPSDLYPVASRCFQCHTVPHEELVNKGGHGTGSSDFELAEWSQGEIRHNFLDSFLHGDGTVNEEKPQAHKRVLYVLGRALDVEYSLRGIAIAKEKRRYFKAMSRRLRVALGELRAVQRLVPSPQLTTILQLVKDASIVPNNETALLATCKKIGDATQAYLKAHDGKDLAALDPLMRGEVDVVDEPVELASRPENAPESGDAGSRTATSVDTSRADTSNGTQPRVEQNKALGAIAAVGKFRTRIRPAVAHQTIGSGQCSGCHRHEKQSSWWFEDKHYAAADAFFAGDAKVARIARLYGLAAGAVTRGDSVCMDCHGTVVSGKEKREVSDGVGCESCHGPAADYVDSHQDGDPALGAQRPGYVQALTQGMVKLVDAETRAQACASCHYITDERLLSAGHGSGEGFDFAAAMKTVRHWEAPFLDDGRLQAAYKKTLAARGPVPKVTLARDAQKSTPARPSQSGSRPVAQASPSASRETVPRPKAPRARPLGKSPAPGAPVLPPKVGNVGPLDLPPFPEVDPNISVEDLLRLIEVRLQLLHDSVKKGDGSP